MRSRAASQRTRGFTLLEMAVVLVIIGVMVGLVNRTQNALQPSGCYVETKKQLDGIREAVNSFVRNKGRLPAPARRDVGVRDSGYGREIDPTVPAQLATIDRYDPGGSKPPILFGALPFQSLNLPESYAADCWGNKFSFVVTQAMTSSSTSGGYGDPSVMGGITLKTSAGVTVSDAAATPSTGLNWAVISHGENGQKVGGVERNYSAAKGWCAVAAALDTENCDVGNVTLYDAPFNNGANAGASYFDDLLAYGGRYVSSSGNTFCWGDNTYGMLGNGTTGGYSSTPVAVTMPAGVTYFTKIERGAGAGHIICGAGDDDNTYCWGEGTTLGWANKNVPTLVTPPGGIKIAAMIPGPDYTNALGTDDYVYWWQGGGWNQTWTSNAHHSSATRYNICAIDNNGDEWCWGDGWAGQNGDGGTANHGPLKVTMPGGRTFMQTAGGYANYCAIADNGESYCWGSNDHGEGGNNYVCGTPNCLTPYLTIRPAPVAYWKSVDASYAMACWIADTNNVYCAGEDSACALGLASCTSVSYATPTLLPALAGGVYFTQLALGGDGHHCGLGSDGKPYCWGYGAAGGLGNGTTPYATNTKGAITMPPGITKFTQLGSSGGTTCGVTAPQVVANELVCWGSNWTHQLGDSTTDDHKHPHRITKPAGVTGWLDVAGSGYDTCGLATNFKVYCWGSGGSSNGSATGTPVQMAMPGNVPIASIYAGGDGFCGLDASGNAYCWYYSGSKPVTSSTPAAVTMPGVGFTTMSLGYHNSSSGGYTTTVCAIGTDGNGYCWGRSPVSGHASAGLVGDNAVTNRANPVAVTMPGGGVKFTKIASGTYFNCALGDNGREYCWGWNAYSQMADTWGPDKKVPTLVALPGAATAITDIAVGEYIHCVAANDGKNYCAGRQDEGQAANGVISSSAVVTWTPMLHLPGNTAFAKIYYASMVSSHSACGVTTAGKLYCWGGNTWGQLGNNSKVTSAYPTEVENLGYASTVSRVAVMDQHTCAIVQ